MKNNQKGFGVLETVIILAIIGILSLGGWFVWRHIHNDTTSSSKQNAQKNKEEKTDKAQTVYTIPENYKLYENAEFGFKFSYPMAVGDLSVSDDAGNPNILQYLKSSGQENVFAPNTRSPLYVRVDKDTNFVTRAAKYGPMLEYRDGKWLVSSKEGGDVNNGGYAVGSEYKAAVAKTSNGTLVYDLSLADEGCRHTVWVFKTIGAFVSITLPAVCADEIDTIPQERLDIYDKEVEKVLQTLQLSR